MKRKLLFKKGLHLTFWCFSLVFLLLPSNSVGQAFTGTYTFTGSSGNVSSFAYNGSTITNLTVSPLTKEGVTTSSSSGNFRANDWDTGSTDGGAAGGSVNLSKYFQFTISATSGYTLSNMSINFGAGRSSTGPRLFQWRSSVDNYATLLPLTSSNGSVSITSNVLQIPDANNGYTGNTATSSATGVTSITFRVYAYGSESTGGTGGLQGNLIFNGTLAAVVTAPVVTTDLTPSSIGTTSATLGGNVTSDGGSAVTGRGIVYAASATNTNPLIGGTGVVDSSTTGTTGTFSVSESSLNVNTSYSYKAYATNSINTGYGNVQTFYTFANTPSSPTVTSPTTSSLDVLIVGGDGNPSSTEYAIYETGGGLFVQSNGSLSATPFWQTASAWSTITVTGLSSNTEYGFDVVARNGANIETAHSGVTNATTDANASPTFESDLLADFGNVCLNANGINTFTFIGYNLDNSTVTVGPIDGFTFSTTLNGTYTSTLNYTADINGDLAETVYVKFTPTLVQSYNGNISISGGGASSINVATLGAGISTAATIVTGTSSSITATTASATGNVVLGCSAVISSGIEYSISNDFSGSVFVNGLPASLTGLSPNTQYFYRAVVTDATGTIVGNSDSFTTLAITAPTANAGTDIEQTQFTANWDVVDGASSYRLDVSTSSTFGITTPTSNLIISEYGEGNGGSKKYIEIYNGTGVAVNLSNYEIWAINNGGSWPESTISLSGTLPNNTTYVIANNATDVFGADLYSGALTFNGDDATGLAWNGGSGTTFTLLDAVGEDGNDPGSGWAVAGINNATADKILIRKPTVLAPNTDWSSSAGTNVNNSEWIVSSFTYNNTNQTTNLGSHSIDNTSPSFVAGYENLQVFGNSQVVSVLMASTNYYYRVRAESSNSLSSNSDVITVMTSAAPPSFGTILQSGDIACENTSVNFFVVGLIPNSVSTLTYNINGGSDIVLTNVVANGSGLAQIGIVLQAANNGQTLTVTKVERTDIVSPELLVTENNTVVLQVTANATFYADSDGDGYGVDSDTIIACVAPVGYAALSGDCNDNNPAVNPGATEICWNGIDDNCDTLQSEGCAPIVVNMATANNSILPSFAIA
ncbi:MAG: lamin tail domain-containing protein, partial [Bacteroidetes bacterium]|nr:lamin tail domain-containing protein [Bacteroidota bacterium]